MTSKYFDVRGTLMSHTSHSDVEGTTEAVS